MTTTDTAKKIGKSAAVVGGALAAAFVPQYCSANVVTVGFTGETLSSSNSTTNLGGRLGTPLSFYSGTFGKNVLGVLGMGENPLGPAYASTQVVTDPTIATRPYAWQFFVNGTANGATFGSSNNWVPGIFTVSDGAGGQEPTFGWLQVALTGTGNPVGPTFTAEIVSFTYNNMTANTDPASIPKPVGGFSAVPEPSSMTMLALLATGAGGLSWYRRRNEAEAAAA